MTDQTSGRQSSIDNHGRASFIDLPELPSTVLPNLESHYLSLLGTLPAIIYTLDEKGHFTFLSESIKQLGYSPRELIGLHFRCLIHPDEIKSIARDYVLPSYKGVSTGPEKAPKLFDERRSPARKTQDLRIRLCNSKQTGTAPSTFSFCKINASGQYDFGNHDETPRFWGTIGVITDVVQESVEQISVQTPPPPKDPLIYLIGSLTHSLANIFTAIYGNFQLIEMETNLQGKAKIYFNAVKENLERGVELTRKISSLLPSRNNQRN